MHGNQQVTSKVLKGDKGENGKDGFTPEVTVTDNQDGSHTITITQPEGKPALTTVVKNGVDGQTPKVKAVRDEDKKQTTLTFYIDKDGDGNYTEGTDTLIQTSICERWTRWSDRSVRS